MNTSKVATILVVIFFVIVAIVLFNHLQSSTYHGGNLLGHQAPSFEGINLLSKEPITLKQLEKNGKLTVINFMASWCPPCHEEEPTLARFYYYDKTKINLISIAMNDTPSNAKSFALSNNATWPLVLDPQGAIAISYGVTGPPETFFISPQNIVLAKLVGPANYTQLISTLKSLTPNE
jgi:cytochrome c biogenesis protein CcmG/thiol:disulfide interchange protein DsbE